jgi:hypothetical protein
MMHLSNFAFIRSMTDLTGEEFKGMTRPCQLSKVFLIKKRKLFIS